MHPILFTIFGFQVHTFGVAMVVAFILSVSLAQARGPRFGITRHQMGDLAFWAIFAGVFGARFLFIVQDWHYFATHPRELFTLQFQGLTSFGGLIFGALAAIAWAWRKRIPVRNLLDAAAPAFLVGHLVGRVGCLMNGCCFGGACPVGTPWGIHVDNSPLLHHPAQIYDSLMNLAALGLVLFVERRATLKAGAITGRVIVFYGDARFIYEFWRAGTDAQVARGEASSTYWDGFPLHITQAQGMAAVLVFVGFAILVLSKRPAPLPMRKDDETAPLSPSAV